MNGLFNTKGVDLIKLASLESGGASLGEASNAGDRLQAANALRLYLYSELFENRWALYVRWDSLRFLSGCHRILLPDKI